MIVPTVALEKVAIRASGSKCVVAIRSARDVVKTWGMPLTVAVTVKSPGGTKKKARLRMQVFVAE